MRLYLGANKTPKELSESYNTFLNFPSKINMTEGLGLDVHGLAVEIAFGLAVIH